MKKVLFPILSIVLLSGCAISSTFTISSDGQVSGSSTISVPKSALRNVTTVQQWEQLLSQNNVPTPSASPEDTASASPSTSPSAHCESGEDLVTNEWTYSCSATGDLSILSGSLTSSGVGQLSFSRDGSTITISQDANASGEEGGNPFGIKGVSLLSLTTRITFPGDVDSVAGGATKIDQHTVEFTSDENQSETMSATVTIPDFVSTAPKLNLSAQTNANQNSGMDVLLTATLDSAVLGEVQFFDGSTGVGQVSLDSSGKATLGVTTDVATTHNYSAKFMPIDWWKYDQVQAQQSVTIGKFRITAKPKISGQAKVGAKLSVIPAKATPVASKVTYQWLRNGVMLKGKTSTKYTVTSADYKKVLTVKVTLAKAGVISSVTYSNAVTILSK